MCGQNPKSLAVLTEAAHGAPRAGASSPPSPRSGLAVPSEVDVVAARPPQPSPSSEAEAQRPRSRPGSFSSSHTGRAQAWPTAADFGQKRTKLDKTRAGPRSTDRLWADATFGPRPTNSGPTLAHCTPSLPSSPFLPGRRTLIELTQRAGKTARESEGHMKANLE